MSKIDIEYHKLLKKVLKEGRRSFDTSRQMDTFQLSSYNLDLTDMISMPIITTKKVNYKSILAELDFFLKGQTNIKHLIKNNCNIWNKDAYNHYVLKCKKDNIVSILGFDAFVACVKDSSNIYNLALPKDYTLGDLGPVYGAQWHENNQFKVLIENLNSRNFNRRLIVNAWNTEELPEMALPPCHWAFEIIQHKDGFILKWHQRSVDTFLGLPFNILSYYILGKFISLVTFLPFYGLIGDLSNIHIYEEHLAKVDEQLNNNIYSYSNRETELITDNKFKQLLYEYQTKKINFNRFIQDIDLNNWDIINYNSYPIIKSKMIAPLV